MAPALVDDDKKLAKREEKRLKVAEHKKNANARKKKNDEKMKLCIQMGISAISAFTSAFAGKEITLPHNLLPAVKPPACELSAAALTLRAATRTCLSRLTERDAARKESSV